MWQKLSRIDIEDLIQARTQLINAIQLVSAVSRTYSKNINDDKSDWLMWDMNTSSLCTKDLGTKETFSVTLDITQFVLSLEGRKGHIEHLVLSGISYPMAFGWMKIKLDTFGLDGEIYNDKSIYTLDDALGVDDEMRISDQDAFNHLVIYLSNTYSVFKQLRMELQVQGEISLNPANFCLELTPDHNGSEISFGFCPGDKLYLSPYFYLKIESENLINRAQVVETIGIWNNKNWQGLVFLADEFITLELEDEKKRVMDFFTINYRRIINH